MTAGKFLVRTLAIAVAMFILGYIGHQLLLGPDYVAIEPIMRNKADMQAHMPVALTSCLSFSAAFVWIYSQIHRTRPWPTQGLRFGLAVWAVSTVPLYLTNYTIEPWPGVFVAKILAWELLAAVALGLLAAAMAKNDLVGEAMPQQTTIEEPRYTDAAPERRKA
jgi:hypothetical protein